MFAADRKPAPSGARSAAPKDTPRRGATPPVVNQTWQRLAMSVPPVAAGGAGLAGPLQRKCAACGGGAPGGECPACDEEKLHRKAHGAGGGAGVPASVPAALRSGGEPLDAGVRAPMERSLGHDLSGVRVHRGPAAEQSARDVGALAYTVGSHVVFGRGQYSPGSGSGRELLAHELVHVVQQSRGQTGVHGKLEMSAPGDADERAADAAAPLVARGEPVQVGPGAGGAGLHRSVNATPRLQPSTPDPDAKALLVHLHANEENAGDVAAQMFATRCTNFVDLSPNAGTREVEVTDGTHTIDVDPNRIFTPEGRQAQVASGVRGLGLGSRTARRAAEASLRTELDTFANDLIDKIGRGRLGPGGSLLGPLPIVALHNNVEGDARTPFVARSSTSRGSRPGLSIRSYLRSDPLQPRGFRPSERGATDPANPPHIAPGQSEEDFFVVTDPGDFTALSTGAVTSGQERNVALQNATPPNDGSLSVATAGAARDAAAAGTLPAGTTQTQANRYFNVEAGGKSRTARGAAGTVTIQASMTEDVLDRVGAGLRSAGCGPGTTSAPPPTPPATTSTGTVQPKLAPTPEPGSPRLMRQPVVEPPKEEEEAGTTRVVRPVNEVGGKPITGNEQAEEGLLDWLRRLLDEAIRVLEQWSTLPPTQTPQAVPASTDRCRTFADEAALDRRKAHWKGELAKMATADVLSWFIGRGKIPKAARTEAENQVLCMLKAMKAAKVANLPSGKPSLGSRKGWVKSHVRDFDDQNDIWMCKWDFRKPADDARCVQKFGRVTPEAIAACPTAGLTLGGEWDRDDDDHRACWKGLSDEQRQREILTTSSAPGISRHHQGTDFDLFSTSPSKFEAGQTFAPAYSWLQANAIQYGFIQSFDPLATFMSLGYTEERWHWSYYPISQALLEFAADNLRALEALLLAEWGSAAQFSFIRKHWQQFLFNVHQTPTSPVAPSPPPTTTPTP